MDAVAWRGCGRVTGNNESIKHGLIIYMDILHPTNHKATYNKVGSFDIL